MPPAARCGLATAGRVAMTSMAPTLLSGRRTCRGIGITRTVSCQMRAVWSPQFGAGPTYEIPTPFPFSLPGYPLAKRHGIYIKYFSPDPATEGIFYLIERQAPSQVSQRGYPLQRHSISETRKRKRLKQVFLPITGSIRIYGGNPAIEAGSSLEFG